jgi:hypothetical protein
MTLVIKPEFSLRAAIILDLWLSIENSLMCGTRAACLSFLSSSLNLLRPPWTCSRLKSHQPTPGTSVQPLSPS